MRTSLLFFSLSILLTFNSDAYAQSYRDYYQIAIENYKEKKYKGFISALVKADSLRPNHPTILYNLAAGYSLLNENTKALQSLKERAVFNAGEEFLNDDDFQNFRTSDSFTELVDFIESNTKHISTSIKAFSINEPNFHPEGIEFDETNQRFLFTDVHTGQVVSYNTTGSDKQIITNLPDYGFWGAFGIKRDPLEKDILWVTTASVPEFKFHEEINKGKTALIKIDITTGKVLESYTPEEEGAHLFGDLYISKKGVIYITDSISPEIFRMIPAKDSLELFFTSELMWNLQGITMSEDEKTLFVSDYILGLYRIELSTQKVFPFFKDSNSVTRATDGIYFVNGEILLLQNGTVPRRISSIKLSSNGRVVKETVEIRDQSVSGINEPTLGVVVGNELYFIGNSPWAFYDQNGIPKTEDWPLINIFKLSIKP